MAKVIAVTGFAGAGKSTSIAILEAADVGQRLYVGQIVIDEVVARGLAVTPENELKVRTLLRTEFGPLALAERTSARSRDLLSAGINPIIDAVLSPAELDFYLQSLPQPIEVLAIEASFSVRATRLRSRGERPYDDAQLRARDEIERNALRTDLVLARANHRITNESDTDALATALAACFSR